ncbi:MAG TPA: hypothetical protein VJO16_15945 [Candidatus Acidoferrum sp.]|nr:hypothetical protein [Candidatus Acidoferrum sp.]
MISGGSGYGSKHNLKFRYSFFGHSFSSNLPLPGVIPTNSSKGPTDIELHLGIPQQSAQENPPGSEELIYVSSETNSAGEPALRILKVERGEFVRLAYEDGTKFWLDRKRENVWATWPDTSSLENTASYLLGPVLGLVLRLRGVTCLHASAVSFGDHSVAFVGSTGAGKSTTAAAFARQGYRVLSDDIVPLEERQGDFYVQPAYPYLCLWPDSVQVLYGSVEGFPRFIPDWDKRRLDLGQQGTRFENRSLRLGAIYVLGERRPDPAPYIEPMKPQKALLALVADTYANKILDRELRAREFAILGRLVASVPVRRVCPNEDARRLEELCKVIRRDFDSLELPQSARP